MAFPRDPLPIKQELLINGVWTDITSSTRNSDNVNITRGFSSEQANLSSSQCTFTLNNRDGKFSNRNPTSPYYRQIGRNTQYRVSVTELTNFIHFRDYSVVSTGVYDSASVSTADKASLDIVGDIDIRIEIEPDNWQLGNGVILAGKYMRAGNQRSWILFTSRQGNLYFSTSADGTGTLRTSASSVPIPSTGRIALRVTLDVDNGASGSTCTFYTAPTINGTYTQLGTASTIAGVTSIYSGTGLLEIGNVDNAGRASIFQDTYPLVGRVYGFQMRNGIGGSVVANMDPSVRSPGDIVWFGTETVVNQWQTAHSAPVSNSDYRFWGETSTLPQRWDVSGRDVYVPVSAADILQRLQQGQKALQSPIFRNLTQYAPTGYWPLEDGSTDGTAFSSYAGTASQLTDANFGNDPSLPGTAGVLTFNDDSGYAQAMSNVVPVTFTTFELFYFKMPSIPLTDTPIIQFYHKGGLVYRVQIFVGSTGYKMEVIAADGLVLYTQTSLFGASALPTQWVGMRVRIVNTGIGPVYTSTIDWGWYGIGSNVFYGSATGTFSGTPGRVESWISFPYTGKSGLSLAHVFVADHDVPWADSNFYRSTNGYSGETAGARANRLSKEEQVPFWVVGNYADKFNEAMGPQTTSTYLDLIKECADVAGALLYSPRDKFGLAMRLRDSLINQTSAVLSYPSNHFSGSLEPSEDDTLIRNDVTVQRPNGGSARAVKLTGSLNTGDPTSGPDAVGTYDTTLTLNSSTDDRLASLAARAVFFGTWDELRYTRVQMEMERAPYVASATLTRTVRALDLGDPFTITGLPKWLPPEDVELMVIGYTETLKNRGQLLVFNTAPYGPYRMNDLTGSTRSRQRAAASNSATNASMTTTATSMSVATPLGGLWSTTAVKPGNFPLDVMVAGERMTVTAVTGTSSPQTFTVTRSVNGVVKVHLAGETVQVFDTFYAGII